MDPTQTLDRIEQLFAAGDPNGASHALSRFLSDLGSKPATLAAASAAMVSRLETASPNAGAHFALGAGALIEAGVAPHGLAAAILEPLIRALRAAAPFVELASSEPDADEGDDAAVSMGDRMLSQASIGRLMVRDPVASGAFFSLETWYRPTVAAWTRDTTALRRAQSGGPLRRALDPLAGACAGSYWLDLLLGTAVEMPLVVLLPETGEAYMVRLDGCSDMGQTTVLLSDALADPLRRIGVTKSASRAMLAVMRGEKTERRNDLCYGATFRAYPWQAIDPSTGLPADRRFRWLAPGGSGTHSLPIDFQPSALTALDGTRVMALVGPRGPGMQFTREISGVRMFEALRATVDQVRKLPPDEARRWAEVVRAAASTLPASD